MRAWLLSILLLSPSAHSHASDLSPPKLLPPASTAIAASPEGTLLNLTDADVKFQLFLPKRWNPAASNLTLCIHFHTAADTVIAQHLARAATEPLAVFVLGSGSAAYRKPFEDTNRFTRMISLIEAELHRRAGHPVSIHAVDISSFSAGYGAVRELVRSPSAAPRIRRIFLLDSLYAGLEAQIGSTNRVPLAEHIDVWLPFARAAVRGEKTIVITTSDVPTPTYASTRECADAIVKRLNLQWSEVSSAPSESTTFSLQARADAGNFHVWSYTGINAAAHMAHVRNMAMILPAP